MGREVQIGKGGDKVKGEKIRRAGKNRFGEIKVLG